MSTTIRNRAAAAAAVTMLAAVTACGASHSHPAAAASASARAHAVIAAAATSTAVAADKAQARKDVTACVNTGHVKVAEDCLKADVPPAKRHALKVCLADAALAGWASFKATGAQACVSAALQ